MACHKAFSLYYSSVDEATAILSQLGPGALLAKVDLKSAFRMVPVRREDWELLGIRWKQACYTDTCLPLDYGASCLALFCDLLINNVFLLVCG